ncbi:radical SAM protein [Alphaproteobacteria bacterium]|nr:radical SAM protein [Alphaproteobacteria bacterium]
MTQQAQIYESIQKKNVPINKGHFFELESKERIDNFTRKLSYGWEEEYKEYRRLWNELPKKGIVREYPLLIDLETVSRCNLKCPMCPTITDDFINRRVKPFQKGQMDMDLITRILNEVEGKIYSLRLSWIGEPTLNKHLIDAIKLAKQKNIKEVSFLTNGYKLKEKYFLKLLDAGIDIITISVDGMGDTYNKIRYPLKFDDTVKKLEFIQNYKTKNNLDKPLIKIQGVWPAIREYPEKFYNLFKPITDLIAFNPLIDYLHNDDESKIVYEENFACPQHYQRLTIGSSGIATMCSNDDMMYITTGNTRKESIYDIWHGDKLSQIRSSHSSPDGFKQISACRKCYVPRKTEESEKAFINGREVHIENYINRNQKIGE